MVTTGWLRRLTIPAAIGLALLLAFATFAVGLRLSGTGRLASLPGADAIDYRSRPGPLAPLSARFIASILGGDSPTAGLATAGRASTAATSLTAERVTDVHPLTNDNFSDARDVPGVPYTAKTDTRQATREANEPADCAPVGKSTVWYRYQPPDDVGLVADTFGSDYATALGVFQESPGGLSRVGCDTNAGGNAIVAFAAAGGTTYYFQVVGPVGGGDLVFNLDVQGVTSTVAHGFALSLSGDGNIVAFAFAPGVVPPGCDTCNQQIYVSDRSQGTTTMVSVDSAGQPGNTSSDRPFLSGDGRYVAFQSDASNLVTGDTNGATDVFVHDLVTGETVRASVTSTGAEATGVAQTVAAYRPTLSWDGRYVAFDTPAALTPDDTNNDWDAYVHDMVTGVTERVSAGSNGPQGDSRPAPNCDRYYCPAVSIPTGDGVVAPSISPDGRFVKYNSNLPKVPEAISGISNTFVYDRETGQTELVSVGPNGQGGSNNELQMRYGFSADDRYVVFDANSPLVPDDTNGTTDTYVHDRLTGETFRASVSSSGDQVPSAKYAVRGATISADGRYVAFQSDAPNLVPGDDNAATDVFVRDLLTGTTLRVSVTTLGKPTDGAATFPSLSADGNVVAFAQAYVAGSPGPTVAFGPGLIDLHERPARR